jgi:HAD superfamily hydrolase (TIGR01509 family)
MIGLNVPACKQMLKGEYGSNFPVDELEMSASSIYFEYLGNNIPVKPGLLELVDFLEAHEIPRAVATSTATDFAIQKLNRAGVLRHFQVVIGGDQVFRGKPDPDIYLLAAGRIKQRPQDCLALEDSEPGVLAAAAAGMQTVLIPDLVPPSAAALSAARFVVPSLLDVIPVMKALLHEPR